MTPIKIYFDDYPGQNLAHSGQGTLVWHKNIFNDSNNYKNSFYPILDVLGFPYTFSKDEDAIPILDIGSLHPKEQTTSQLISEIASKFKKVIVCSTQEPFQWADVENLLNTFPNIFMLDTATPLANGKVFHERYANFPFFLCRMLSPRLHIMISPGDDVLYNKNQNKMFSCLMARWRLEKHMLYSMLLYNNLVKDNFVTYRSLFDADDAELLNTNISTDKHIEGYQAALDMLMPYNSSDLINYTKEGLRNFHAVTLHADIILDEAQYDRDAKELGTVETGIKWHDPMLRGQPKFLFDKSFFSLICESFSGANYRVDPLTGNYELLNTRGWISEKTITPLMNGHPWLVFGEVGFYRTMESYGFAVHDELFDLDFDSNTVHGDRLSGVQDNLLSLTMGQLQEKLHNPNSDTHQKIRHNRYNVFNTSSTMWQELRKNMTAVIERFRDLDV
jgi:hypothetical protein